MRKLRILLGATILLLGAGSAVLADDDAGTFLDGTASVGAHYGDFSDNPQKAGEFISIEDLGQTNVHMLLDLLGGDDASLFDIQAYYFNTRTKGFDFGLHTSSLVSANFSYQSFVHNLGHDTLVNLQAREANPDGAGGFTPGGKQIYHTDNDPLGRYYYQYQDFTGDVSIDLPFLADGQVYGAYHDQRRTGYKQTMTIDHCAFCHVEGNSQRVDEETRTWRSGLDGTLGLFTFNYEFKRREYLNLANSPQHRWKNASHPVNGGAQDEFSSRLIFEDTTLPYASAADNTKTNHFGALKAEVGQNNVLSGSYTYRKQHNDMTGQQNTFDSWAAAWSFRPGRKFRVNAKFYTYEIKADDYYVDLPNFRAQDTATGNLNFDWNRVSAAQRKVYRGELDVGYRLGKTNLIKVNWRHDETDRDAMTQTQTTYNFDDPANPVEIASTPFANKTTTDRIRALYRQRLGRQGSFRLDYTYTNSQKPFMNPNAMCEESLEGTSSIHANGRLYYFQRQRYGNGTNQATQSHRGSARGTFRLSDKTSLNAFVTYAKEKNDELNIYQFERDVLIPGFNIWTAPTPKLMFTFGYTYNSYKSNANLCPPIFDG